MSLFDELRDRIGVAHGDAPQRHWHAQDALRRLEEARRDLMSHGIHLEIVEVKPEEPKAEDIPISAITKEVVATFESKTRFPKNASSKAKGEE